MVTKLRTFLAAMRLPYRLAFDPLVVIAAWAIACWPWLTGAKFINGDSIGSAYPESHFVVSSLRHHDAPWWNPTIHGGQPLLGDPQSLIFIPHTLVGLLFGKHDTLNVFDVTTVACLLCGGLAMRHLGAFYANSRMLPILGAIVFMLGGVAATRLQHVGEIVSYSLLPLQMLAMRAACQKPSLPRAGLLAISLLAGLLNPNQVVFLSLMGLAPFFGLFLWQSPRPKYAAAVTVGAALIAVLAALPVLTAVAEFVAISNRPHLPLEASAPFSFPLLNLVSLVVPGLFGALTPKHGYWAPTDPSQDYLYIGIVPAGIVLFLLLRGGGGRAITWLCAVMAVFWFVFALGTHAPLYPFLFDHLPGLAGFRRPADGAFMLNVTIALMVATAQWSHIASKLGRRTIARAAMVTICLAAGLIAVLQLNQYAATAGHSNELHQMYRQAGFRLLAVLAVGALLLPFRGRGATILLPFSLVCLTTADLVTAGRFSPAFTLRYKFSPIAQLYGHAKHLGAQAQAAEDTLYYLKQHGVSDTSNPQRAEFLSGPLSENAPSNDGIAVTQGYNPIALDSYAHVIGVQNLGVEAKQFTLQAPDYSSELYRRLGLRYVLFDIGSITPGAPGMLAARNMALRTRLQATNIAKLLGRFGDYEIWEEPGAYAKAEFLAADGTRRPCEIQAYRNTDISLRCATTGPSVLVVGDNASPGWFACVNGNPAPVATYQGTFRQIAIPAGLDMVTLHYQPVPFWRGAYCEKPGS